MRLGVQVSTGGLSVEAIVGQVREAAEAGLDSAYFNQVLSWDAIGLAMLSASQVPGIDVGTAVTPTYPRHPLALASQALTAQAASGNRFTLGIGPSHRPIIEEQFGYSYDRPARHVREYLTALLCRCCAKVSRSTTAATSSPRPGRWWCPAPGRPRCSWPRSGR